MNEKLGCGNETVKKRLECFPLDAVSRLPRQLVPSINISLAQMRLIFLGTLSRET